jgi:hypothetical protein
MIDKMPAHLGFTAMPFGRDLAPAMLHRHAAHAEAADRITWAITERPSAADLPTAPPPSPPRPTTPSPARPPNAAMSLS